MWGVGLRLERLEDRVLMAGDVWTAQVPPPDGADASFALSALVDSVVQLPGGEGANVAVVRRSGDGVTVVNNEQVLFDQPIGSLQSLTILGAADKPDALTVDMGSGDWAPLGGGIVFDGGLGNRADKLIVRGSKLDDVFTIGSDAVAANAMPVRFLGVEHVTMEGLAGNDAFQVSELSTHITVSDSAGVDVLDFSAAAGVKLNLSKGSAQAVSAGNENTLTLKGRIENAVGSPWDDEIRGNSAANRIDGRSGADALYGGDGNDFLSGGEGDDRLHGESGNDVVLGGSGSDRLSAGAGKNILIGGEGEDSLRGSSGEEILIGGTTLYDDSRDALVAILARWNSGSFQDRVNRLWTGFAHPTLGLLRLSGNIYVGSSSGEIWRYGPAQQSWNVLASPWYASAGSVHHARCLTEGRDGWLYAGSVRGERARVHMATGRVEYLPRIREPGSWYVASCVALPDGRVAFGLGPKARIVVYDPAQGKDVGQWAPRSWRADGYVLTMTLGGHTLFATHFPSGRRGAFDTITGRYLGDAPWPAMNFSASWSTWGHSTGYGTFQDFYVVPSTDTIAASDGTLVYVWDPRAADQPEPLPFDEFDPPNRLVAEMSYGVSSELHVVELQWSTQSVVREIPVPPVPAARRLFALGLGPDGSIYGGAYQNMHLFRYDPRTQELADLGNHSPRWSGETYSFAIRGAELVAASYVNGGVVLYDPQRP